MKTSIDTHSEDDYSLGAPPVAVRVRSLAADLCLPIIVFAPLMLILPDLRMWGILLLVFAASVLIASHLWMKRTVAPEVLKATEVKTLHPPAEKNRGTLRLSLSPKAIAARWALMAAVALSGGTMVAIPYSTALTVICGSCAVCAVFWLCTEGRRTASSFAVTGGEPFLFADEHTITIPSLSCIRNQRDAADNKFEWSDIQKWVVRADSDGPDYYEVCARGIVRHLHVDRHYYRGQERKLLQFIRNVGGIPVELHCAVRPDDD